MAGSDALHPGHPPAAARRWADILASWAIPDRILAQAPEDPWALPVELFRVDDATALTPSHQRAADALPTAGTLLDVGCGGGAASIPLAGTAGALIGVDADPKMLAGFAAAAAAAGVAHREIQGRWPDVAHEAPVADVVVCHHVVYNAPDISEFIHALSTHAGRRVVVELTDRHPQAALNPLWRRFWDLDRPTGPTADLLVEVVAECDYRPMIDRWERPPRKARVDRSAYIAFVRRRLCLGPERDAEIDEALPEQFELVGTALATVYWDR